MTDEEQEQELFDNLAKDPSIAEAAAEHAEGTSCTTEENCWGCNTVKAIHQLSHWEEEDAFDIAMIECDDLESTLRFIAQATRAAQFLSAAVYHASMVAFAHEIEDDEDEDHDHHDC